MDIGILTHTLRTDSGSRAPVELARHLSSVVGHHITLYTTGTNVDIGLQKSLESEKLTIKFFPQEAIKPHQLFLFHSTLPMLFAAWRTHRPIISCYYGTQFNVLNERQLPLFLKIIGNPLANLLIYFKTALMLNLATQIVSISNFTQDELKKLYYQKSTRIYLGCDHLHPTAKKLKQSGVTLISVSRLTPYKNFDFLIKIVRRLETKFKKPLHLNIVGSSPIPPYLKYLKSILPSQAQIFTNISDQALSKLYAQSDIYITADRYLFFGFPILEAANFGLATITTNNAAAHEVVIHNQTGFIANNQSEFTQYLKRLIENQSLRLKFGQAAKKYAKKFTWRKNAMEWEKIIQKVMHETK